MSARRRGRDGERLPLGWVVRTALGLWRRRPIVFLGISALFGAQLWAVGRFAFGESGLYRPMTVLIVESTGRALAYSTTLGLTIAAASVAAIKRRPRLSEWSFPGLRSVPRILVFELAATLMLRFWYSTAVLEIVRFNRMIDWQIVVGVCAGMGLVGYLVLQGFLGIVPAVLTVEGARLWPSLRRSVSLTAGNRWRVALLVLIPLALEAFLELAVRLAMSFAAWETDAAALVWEGAPLLIAGLFGSFNGVLLTSAHRWLCAEHDGVLPNEAAAAFD